MNGRRAAMIAIGAEVVFAASFALLPFVGRPTVAYAVSVCHEDGINGDGLPCDWDCTTMSNRVCGPRNQSFARPGCYDDAGSLVAPWPCYAVVNADGSSDVFTP